MGPHNLECTEKSLVELTGRGTDQGQLNFKQRRHLKKAPAVKVALIGRRKDVELYRRERLESKLS
jgi:hypothetical protein